MATFSAVSEEPFVGPCTTVRGQERALEETKGSFRQAPRTESLFIGCREDEGCHKSWPSFSPIPLLCAWRCQESILGASRAVGLLLVCENGMLLF